MAGLLAANMLARHKPAILEAQSSLPNNHHSVLRFRSNIVGDVLGIPFQRVSLIKSYVPWKNPVADALAYARKCSGEMRSDRSITSQAFGEERYIAPGDLVQQMASGFNIAFDAGKTWYEVCVGEGKLHPTISTIPMPALMDLLEYPRKPLFQSVPGGVLSATVPNCDAYATLYVPDPSVAFNRVSLTGDRMMIEYAFTDGQRRSSLPVEDMLRDTEIAFSILGFHGFAGGPVPFEYAEQRYAKIQPIEDGERKRFLAWATDEYNIYSLGRFATWRPGLQLDDLIQDVRLIERWIKNKYEVKKSR